MKSIIHFSGDDYWLSNPHSRFHIIKAFNQKNYRVLWINPLGIRFPSLKKKNFFNRVVRKISSLIKLLRKVNNNFFVCTPLSIPIFHDNNLQNINLFFWKIQIAVIMFFLRVRKPLLFFSSPIYGNLLEEINYDKSIYYYSDMYTTYRELKGKNKEYVEKLDETLFINSDIILCASKMIYETLKSKSTKELFYLPHQVSFQLFQKASKESSIPFDLQQIKKPVIGYYGTLTDSNDWDIIEYCAKLRPQYNFVFVGRKEIKLDKLEAFNNVFFLGKKDYNEIPLYAACFDVCIMFWIRREWIKNSSPLKLKEYLSAGKPVVSTYIEELDTHYKDVVYISETKEDFLKNIDLSLKSDNSLRIAKGIDMVKNDSWQNAVKKIEDLLSKESQ